MTSAANENPGPAGARSNAERCGESIESPGPAGARSNAERCGELITRCITQLVREAPALDEAVAAELVEQLRVVGSPLALSIARIVELVAEGLIAQAVALPHLAMSCATLVDGIAGRLTERELEAARYEVDTLLPVPEVPGVRAVAFRLPDVPLAALTRGPRRQT